jgi:MFS family permease
MLSLDVVLSTVGMAAWSTTVAFLQVVLHQPAACNGWLVASTGVAGAFGSRLAGRWRMRRSTYVGLLIAITVSYLSVPHVHQLAGLVVVWLLRGFCIGVFVVSFSQCIARETPPELMGRVQAAWEMSACLAAFLGSVSTPWLIRHLGPAGSFDLFGSITLTVALVWAIRSR